MLPYVGQRGITQNHMESGPSFTLWVGHFLNQKSIRGEGCTNRDLFCYTKLGLATIRADISADQINMGRQQRPKKFLIPFYVSN